MARNLRLFCIPPWILLAAILAAPLAGQSRDPRDTALFREMKVQDPDSFFIPPLILKHVIQLPSPWQDPLGPDQAVAAGPVREVTVRDGAVEVVTAAMRLTVAQEGGGLHFVVCRLDAGPNEIFPPLAIKERQPRQPLFYESDEREIRILSRVQPGVLCRFSRADGSIEVPWGPAGEPRSDRYRAVYSKSDKRLAILSTLDARDHVYGLGMKTGLLDRRDQNFIMWNFDGYGYNVSKDPIYASIPFYLLTTGEGKGCRGVYVDDTSDVTFDFGRTYPGWTAFSTVNGQAGFYVFRAPRMADVLRAYQDLTGVFQLPPVWALGYHQSAHTYFPESRVMDIARGLRDRNLPCDALYLDIIHQDGYRPFTWNKEYFPDPGAMIRKLHELGFRVIPIVDPGIKVDQDYPVFQEGRAKDYFLRVDDGRLYAGNIWPGYSVFPDFLQAGCRDWWSHWHETYLRQGVDAFKNDMSEPATFNGTWSMLAYDEGTKMPGFLEQSTLHENVVSRSREWGSVPHRFFHNVYGLYESVATWNAQERFDQRRPFVLMRNTSATGQKTTYIWTGDSLSDWPSLRLSVQLLLSLNLSGFPICGADNGGFGGRCTPELYTRWTEFSAFSPFFRTHYFYVEQCLDKEPWAFGPETEAVVGRYIRLRYRLLPYLYTAVWRARDRKEPLLQPLFFRWEDDPAAYTADSQYLWGDDFLVAPVVDAGARGRFVYLPRGAWYDFWTDQAIASAGESRYVDAPLDTIPVYVRAGAIVPAMEPGRNTADFPPRRVILESYLADGVAAGELYLDDGATRDHVRGRWTLCRFRLQQAGPALNLTLESSGPRRFLPRQLVVRARGAAGGCRTLRFQGREIPLQADGECLVAEIASVD